MTEPSAERILKTLVEILESRHGVKIIYTVKERTHEPEYHR